MMPLLLDPAFGAAVFFGIALASLFCSLSCPSPKEKRRSDVMSQVQEESQGITSASDDEMADFQSTSELSQDSTH